MMQFNLIHPLELNKNTSFCDLVSCFLPFFVTSTSGMGNISWTSPCIIIINQYVSCKTVNIHSVFFPFSLRWMISPSGLPKLCYLLRTNWIKPMMTLKRSHMQISMLPYLLSLIQGLPGRIVRKSQAKFGIRGLANPVG